MEEPEGSSRRCMFRGFNDSEEEKLYAAYTDRQRQRAVPRLLATVALLQVFVAFVPGERSLAFAYGSIAIALAANLLLALLYLLVRRARTIVSHLTWLVVWAQLLVTVSRRIDDSYNELLGWALVLQYFTLATLPFNKFVQTIYSIISFFAYMVVQYYVATYAEGRPPLDFNDQQLSNGLLLCGTSIIGFMALAFNEYHQRKSFRVTKKSLRDKLTIEQQSKEQERLLLSVLPEHVAVQMRQDLGLIDTQFKKIYMSRHENVSILYADIVGFTAISSTYSAQDLVAILNELFARFDRLAEKYQQLRIKILGDCYYCISGAPVERPDHAVLCVHMGLSMVKAIKYVQQTTSSPVDMRVGIHTGAVLAGVLGQRQWQFDVYSRDVELANKMESSGMAGRVHISEVTLSYLNDEFEVEPAHGEKREDMLRQAGIKTFFIVRVLKPWQGSGDERGGEGDGAGGDALFDLKDDDDDSVLSPQDETKGDQETKILSMLQEELVNRDDDKELADATTVCLTFKSQDIEESYSRRVDSFGIAVVIVPLVFMPAVIILASFAVPPAWSIQAVYITLVVECGIVNLIYIVYLRFIHLKGRTIGPYWKLACGLFNISVFVAANIAPLIICGQFEASLLDGLPDTALSHAGARRCAHPSYYYHVGAGAACGALWVSPLSGGARFALLAVIAAAHALPAILQPAILHALRRDPYFLPYNATTDYNEAIYTTLNVRDRYFALLAVIAAAHALPAILQPAILHALRRDPYFLPYNATTDYNEAIYTTLSQVHAGRNVLMLFLIVIALLIFNRYTEALERARHSRGQRMRLQAEQAADLRRRNQALVHNVLPPHVASHFMGARHHHRDLYSQSYAEVGVLFASMPNFSEFYSEETVNNQGLECLRFLNEVISDFDLLLEDNQFKDIIKIKTISSTYMAASGLNPTRQMQPTDGVLVRWKHLECLVEFALELQRVLAAINEQSFNHFVLRLGINHGPITAGVIGARKPHYDIWGNTVNVASRMESTGKAGCIQVTEETCHILEEFGYFFEQRGLVAVKGKGQLMTYYLQGKKKAGDGEQTNKPDVSPDPAEGDGVLANGDAEAGRPLLTG